ncbi:hypothetical protein HanRHA438_Chr06g0259191 [Helianthus annuus]|nr:hypothetical protein HanRHA438_Chr06g0259191 [Helianthus annuus]
MIGLLPSMNSKSVGSTHTPALCCDKYTLHNSPVKLLILSATCSQSPTCCPTVLSW